MSEETNALENALQESLTQDHGTENLAETASDTTGIPSEYADKDPATLARMLQDSQAMIGRQSAEVGEMRRFTEQLMQRENERLAALESTQSSEVEWDDNNPQESLKRVVESTLNSRLQGIEKRMAEVSQYAANQQLSAQHSDWQDVVARDEFKSYASSTPIRQELYQRANNGDLAAAQELIGTYKDLNGAGIQAQTQRQSVAQVTSLESGSAATARAATGKPTIRRADIARLQIENPKRYRELLPEIRKAYAEKRVV